MQSVVNISKIVENKLNMLGAADGSRKGLKGLFFVVEGLPEGDTLYDRI